MYETVIIFSSHRNISFQLYYSLYFPINQTKCDIDQRKLQNQCDCGIFIAAICDKFALANVKTFLMFIVKEISMNYIFLKINYVLLRNKSSLWLSTAVYLRPTLARGVMGTSQLFKSFLLIL